ncbi:hypothetical protein Rvan_3651 [Rhodomicrobium vannielii ATCC 17100]|jgi:hypothetical protein|uniref:DUF1467 family protein n=1 Tax=Rhodomicrobium vannielii (strain ATCC 17100 / DSM 162 / LMG 4299 / NCIMB 10020 / ATH 3.1.1) TaxID=648757 RepID=E3I5K5_RHOVT|nr:hypothetical protein [Rhodomicrobium vannielii]ADP72816.1 hypothetical protein Rvan_3651 [Rhodomicrobium vannielii ATCC 17100]
MNILLAIALFVTCWWIVFLFSIPRKVGADGEIAAPRTGLFANVVLATVVATVIVLALHEAISLGIIDTAAFLPAE